MFQPWAGLWGSWGSVPGLSVCAPLQAYSRPPGARSTVDAMGDTRDQECAGRGDGADCPNGEDQTLVDGVRCEECRHHWELDNLEPDRRAPVDVGLTRPMGDPREAGPGTAA